jgi:hypothetical protein
MTSSILSGWPRAGAVLKPETVGRLRMGGASSAHQQVVVKDKVLGVLRISKSKAPRTIEERLTVQLKRICKGWKKNLNYPSFWGIMHDFPEVKSNFEQLRSTYSAFDEVPSPLFLLNPLALIAHTIIE